MFLWRILLKFHKRPNISFLFILKAKDSMHRSKIKDEPFPDSEDVINERLMRYQNLYLNYGGNWVFIDGLDTINSSNNIINKSFFDLLNNNNAS